MTNHELAAEMVERIKRDAMGVCDAQGNQSVQWGLAETIAEAFLDRAAVRGKQEFIDELQEDEDDATKPQPGRYLA